MTTPVAFNPPTIANLPVSLGQDLIVTFRSMVPNSNPVTYQDYPAGVAVTLVVGSGATIVAQTAAVITGSNAECRIESAVVDGISDGTLWRCVVAIPDPDGVHVDHVVPVNGTIVRYDGFSV